MWKEVAVAYFAVLSRNFPEGGGGAEERHENSRLQDFKLGPPKFEVRILPTRPKPSLPSHYHLNTAYEIANQK
jgi:hypothetical protein